MLFLTLDQFKYFSPTSNMVLVKPNRGNEEFRLPNGEKIFLDISYNKEMHAPVVGSVVALPEQIYASDAVCDDAGNVISGNIGMQWDVDMELQVGDTVIYNYLAAMAALDHHEGKMIKCQDDVYFLIPYEECFVAKRQIKLPSSFTTLETIEIFKKTGNVLHHHKDCQVIFPINGYCLVEPVEEQTQLKIGALTIDKLDAFKSSSIRYGKVVFTSDGLIRKYCDGDGNPDIDQVRPGDYICFDVACDLLCEYDLHASLDKNKLFYRMQRRYIHAIISKNLIDNATK